MHDKRRAYISDTSRPSLGTYECRYLSNNLLLRVGSGVDVHRGVQPGERVFEDADGQDGNNRAVLDQQ